MKKKPKYKQFIELFMFWCGKLDFPKPITIARDNRLDCPATIEDWDNEKKVCLKYNARRLSRYPYFLIICDVFHEIGHLVNKLPYKTQEEQIESEYQAEKFAVKMMKEHYPKQYNSLLKYLTRRQSIKTFKKEDVVYYEAFKRIKEYKRTMKND